MAQSKKKTRTTTAKTKGKRGPGRPSKKQEPERPEFLTAEVVIIASFAIAVLLFLSNFHLCGIVGDFFREIQLGVFGMAGFLFPLILFVGACFYLSNRGNPVAVIKLLAAVAALLALCGFGELIFGLALESNKNLIEVYRHSADTGLGGGMVGGAVTHGLYRLLGKIGTYLVLFVVLTISVVVITEKSLVSVVKKGGEKAAQYAKEDMDRRKEQWAERQEEKKRIREERVVRGVNLDSTKLMDEPVLPTENSVSEQAETKENHENHMEEPSSEQGKDDVFTGTIAFPQPSSDDEVPFEEETIYLAKDTRTLEEMNLVEEDYHRERTLEEQETDIYMDSTDHLVVPEGERRVVTATGKVIETETELLKKRVEKKRQEAVEEDTKVAVQEEIQKKEQAVKREYKFPPLNLLKKGTRNSSFPENEYKETAVKLQQTLRNFGVGVTVTNISCGPSVTRYELHPEQGVKVSRIVGLADDIKLSLAAADIRIEAPIPGKSAVGIEVPNKENNVVYLRDLLEADSFKNHKSRLAFAVGKDIGGQVVVTDIAKMPHLLIAGATGSGKSVCINTLIMSIIYKSSPEDVKLIMVDPKVVELSVYNGIPHLLIPVVTDPKKASGALNWAVAEMTDRYQKFAQYNVRDLKGYNEKIQKIEHIEDENKPQKLPQIVIIIDELADLMMVAPGEVEDSICRLAQLARAAGIHLVIATQRPSVNVITGLIKANVPSRIAFAVSSGVDSRTIIDMNGAEKLLGKGDMLFYPSGYPKPQRVQGAFVSDEEVQKVVDFLSEQELTTEYNPEVEMKINTASAVQAGGGEAGRDDYFVQAGRFIIEKEKASIGMLQRMFKIGFNRAARIMDQLADAGVVGEEEGTKPRKVLMSMEEFEEKYGNSQ